uniref:Protein sleepless n=1 Tax=Vespula pensylvanica TaxID=30213 RepID=A0A834KW23_VESPE|nr:hypothetical protein H0235_012903 [Vespula pensylvanica]
MAIDKRIVSTICTLLLFVTIGCEAIRCYQCSSDTDQKDEDLCGAYGKFDKERNIPVECSSDESHTPGTFCVKLTQQSPRGFIWNGRWRQVIRRCASVSSTGVTGVCNWGVYENGIYWQECSCSEDSCNGASSFSSLSTMIFVTLSTVRFDHLGRSDLQLWNLTLLVQALCRICRLGIADYSLE